MSEALTAVVFTTVLFLAMLVFSEIGRRVGRARLARNPVGLEKGAGSAEGAIFALRLAHEHAVSQLRTAVQSHRVLLPTAV